MRKCHQVSSKQFGRPRAFSPPCLLVERKGKTYPNWGKGCCPFAPWAYSWDPRTWNQPRTTFFRAVRFGLAAPRSRCQGSWSSLWGYSLVQTGRCWHSSSSLASELLAFPLPILNFNSRDLLVKACSQGPRSLSWVIFWSCPAGIDPLTFGAQGFRCSFLFIIGAPIF